jgi:hypothetical protein
MSTDFRALCAELLDELVFRPVLLDRDLIDRARAALAEPADAPAAVAERPSDKELLEVWCQPWDTSEAWGALKFARAVLARWGQPPASPAEGEVAEMVAWLKENAEYSDYQADPEDAVMFRRAAELLERHAAPVPLPAPQGGEVES